MLTVFGSLLVVLATFGFWQRETIYFIIHPDKIQIKPAGEIRAALKAGDAGVFSYTVLNDAVEIDVTLDTAFRRLDARFNAVKAPVNGVFDAIGKAQEILSPYLSPPEVKALCFILSMEIPAYAGGETLDYTRSIGNVTITITGSLRTGEMAVVCLGEGSS